MQTVLLKLAQWSLGKKALSAVNWVNEKLKGNRTEGILALQAILWLTEKAGIIPDGSADTLQAALLGALPLTLNAKVKRALEIADQIVPNPESKP